MEDALNFVRCIDDKDKERVLSHLQDGSDAERQEAISGVPRPARDRVPR
jgi:hypothetical protein